MPRTRIQSKAAEATFLGNLQDNPQIRYDLMDRYNNLTDPPMYLALEQNGTYSLYEAKDENDRTEASAGMWVYTMPDSDFATIADEETIQRLKEENEQLLAFELGTDTEEEARLLDAGVLQKSEDGQYLVYEKWNKEPQHTGIAPDTCVLQSMHGVELISKETFDKHFLPTEEKDVFLDDRGISYAYLPWVPDPNGKSNVDHLIKRNMLEIESKDGKDMYVLKKDGEKQYFPVETSAVIFNGKELSDFEIVSKDDFEERFDIMETPDSYLKKEVPTLSKEDRETLLQNTLSIDVDKENGRIDVIPIESTFITLDLEKDELRANITSGLGGIYANGKDIINQKASLKENIEQVKSLARDMKSADKAKEAVSHEILWSLKGGGDVLKDTERAIQEQYIALENDREKSIFVQSLETLLFYTHTQERRGVYNQLRGWEVGKHSILNENRSHAEKEFGYSESGIDLKKNHRTATIHLANPSAREEIQVIIEPTLGKNPDIILRAEGDIDLQERCNPIMNFVTNTKEEAFDRITQERSDPHKAGGMLYTTDPMKFEILQSEWQQFEPRYPENDMIYFQTEDLHGRSETLHILELPEEATLTAVREDDRIIFEVADQAVGEDVSKATMIVRESTQEIMDVVAGYPRQPTFLRTESIEPGETLTVAEAKERNITFVRVNGDYDKALSFTKEHGKEKTREQQHALER